MIESLSPWEREDENVIAVIDAMGGELDLVEGFMLTVRDQAWPDRADDTYGLLSVHERTLQLPVAPVGLSLEQRQQATRTRFGRRRDGRKATWRDRVSDLVGGPSNWTYEENHPAAHQITVTLNVLPSSGLAVAVERAIEAFTPVVDELIVTYAPSFFIGESPLGDTEL